MDLAFHNKKVSQAGTELAAAGMLALAAFLLRYAIDPFLTTKHEYLPAYAAVAAATWLIGWRGGALAALMCLASYEFFEPRHPADSENWHMALAYMGYLGTSVAIVSAVEWLRRERNEATMVADELREADRRKSDFMALLGHELRNPLATIAMGGKMLRTGGLDAMAVQGTLDMVERQTERMSRLVGDLLDVSRLQTGKLSLQRKMVDVFTLVQDAVTDARCATDERRQRVVLLQPAPAGFVYADPLRLHQIVVNLVQNASKFSPQGSDIELTVSGDEDQVLISVQDHGVGIPSSQLERIFDPFVQLPAARCEGRGLGLGLPLTRELAQMHGGHVRAFSAGTGRGSQFVVSLPRALPGDAPLPRPETREVIRAEPKPRLTHDGLPAHRILVVDDNEDAATTLAVLLQLKGHQTFMAGDGKGALEVASQQQPDFVFLDIGLPDMNGLEVATKLRELLGAGVTLVALTGWSGDQDRRRSRASGCDAHLTKPVEPEAIDAALALVHGAAPDAAAAAGLRRQAVGGMVRGGLP